MPSPPKTETLDGSGATGSGTTRSSANQGGTTDPTEVQSDPLPATPPEVQPDREHPAHEAEPPVEND
jgi:hypothetical protein